MSGTELQHFGIVRIGTSSLAIPLGCLSEVCHVNRLDTLPLKSDLLLGGFDLRGSIVPVLDVEQVFGLRPETDDGSLCVVVKREDRVLAFYIDEVMDIAKTTGDEIQMLSGPDPETNRFYKGVFKHRAHFVSMIDVSALFEINGVFSASKPRISDRAAVGEKTAPMLVFEVGAALFALPAIEVYAAVPRQNVAVTAITAGPCLGEIHYYNRRVPVICPIDVLNIGAARRDGPCEIVVVRFPGDRLIGLAVDSIRNIESFPRDKIVSAPGRVNRRNLVAGINILPDGRQVYALDIAAVHRHETLTELAGLSTAAPTQDAASDMRAGTSGARNVVVEKEKYLVVNAGRKIAIPLTQVTCIVDPPEQVTPARSTRPGFEGYFSWLGKSVTLIDLAGFLGVPGKMGRERRIVLAGAATDKIGFGVDQIISIEVSNWREKVEPGAAYTDMPAVQLGAREGKSVLPLFDLEKAIETGLA